MKECLVISVSIFRSGYYVTHFFFVKNVDSVYFMLKLKSVAVIGTNFHSDARVELFFRSKCLAQSRERRTYKVRFDAY